MYREIMRDVLQVNLVDKANHFVKFLLREKTFHKECDCSPISFIKRNEFIQE